MSRQALLRRRPASAANGSRRWPIRARPGGQVQWLRADVMARHQRQVEQELIFHKFVQVEFLGEDQYIVLDVRIQLGGRGLVGHEQEATVERQFMGTGLRSSVDTARAGQRGLADAARPRPRRRRHWHLGAAGRAAPAPIGASADTSTSRRRSKPVIGHSPDSDRTSRQML